MAVPNLTLTDSQRRLLAELVLSPLPSPIDDGDAVARRLSPDELRVDVSTLQWMGLITESRGSISATAKGAAVFHRAEQEKAESRLAEVVAFADALEAVSRADLDQSQIATALRMLAQGRYSLKEAIGYL
ncbi:hypothetical protein [Streptomyces lannensis]|uniref:Uncharacterized protein n=1 Tax=Streptomyces lannensis TaxID=766498 RepID=A0ABP7KNB6_9ACTN